MADGVGADLDDEETKKKGGALSLGSSSSCGGVNEALRDERSFSFSFSFFFSGWLCGGLLFVFFGAHAELLG